MNEVVPVVVVLLLLLPSPRRGSASFVVVRVKPTGYAKKCVSPWCDPFHARLDDTGHRCRCIW